jgi:hypothetical protein
MFPNQTLIFECYVVRYVSINENAKDVFEEIGLCAQNMRTFLSFVINIFGVGEEGGRGPI